MSEKYTRKNLLLWRRSNFPHENTRHVFLTKSTFDGSWDKYRDCMHGFGCYKYTDGSSYRGFFRDGKFHGYGCLEMVAPLSVFIKGIFQNGHLSKVEEMRFCDELTMPKKFVNKTYDFSEWAYCNSEDRRFLWEIVSGLKPFGPEAITSHHILNRKLSPSQYDVGEGLFNSRTGFTIQRAFPYKPTSFVPCTGEPLEWIKKNCRGGRQPGEIIEPNQEVCHQIIETNLNSRKWCNGNFGDQCTDNQRECHKYFLKLYKMELEDAKNVLEGTKVKREKELYDENTSACSSSSFSDVQLINTQMAEVICKKAKPARDSVGSISINMSNPILLKNLYGIKNTHKQKPEPQYFS